MTAMMKNLQALWIIVYCLIISTAFSLQIFMNEEPCPLCYLQRVAMLLICSAASMNLIVGIRISHYALAIIGILLGGTVALRQILLHICPGFPVFGTPFWGLSLYTWSFLTFVGSLILIAILLTFYRKEQGEKEKLNKFQIFACVWFILIILANILSVSLQCGLGICEE